MASRILRIKIMTLALLLAALLILPAGLAQSSKSFPSVCCERTKDGALCVNTKPENCAPGARSTPTSCESTSYCKLGTCYDSSEGVCLENTPQSVCERDGGKWDPRDINEVPQCSLGCCIIGDQASFVSLTRCKKLSSFFGVENNFRKDVSSEVECINLASSQEMGACVYEKDSERLCTLTTRGNCKEGGSENRKFYAGLLCSAEELSTSCARQVKTTCKGGKVYWVDSCGNLENVYSADRDASYNNGRIAKPDEVCAPNDGSNKGCGNCDYFLGTSCQKYDSLIGKPSGSDFYCKPNGCVDRFGNKRKNGESWCVYDGVTGAGKDAVGSRNFREVCIDGKIEVEACADFRGEICIQGETSVNGESFSTAACRVNRWQDCILQTEREDCLDIDRRDCRWVKQVPGIGEFSFEGTKKTQSKFSNAAQGQKFTNPISGRVITGNVAYTSKESQRRGDSYSGEDGVCVPNFPPGLKFWEGNSASKQCAIANAKCTVIISKDIAGRTVKRINEECLSKEWAMKMNDICASMGDCGVSVNYIGEISDDGYSWIVDGDKRKFSINQMNLLINPNYASAGFADILFSALFGENNLKTVSATEESGPADKKETLMDSIARRL